MLSQILFILCILFEIVILTTSLYFLIVSLCSSIKRKESSVNDFEPKINFAVLVPAHNEEEVIEQIMDSLNKQNYPSNMYDIYVIADNCNDKTADLAEDAGAIVFRRYNNVDIGKGYALKYAFDRILADTAKQYDAFTVLDADNLADRNYLLEMNKRFCQGYKAVQGNIEGKNTYESWISASYAVAFLAMNRVYQMSRYYLGLTVSICGAGFALSKEIIEKYGWNATCITEDLEYTLILARENIKVAYNHNAIVYDEKPTTLRSSSVQRKRWAQGQIICMKRFFKPLFVKGIKEKNWMAFDAALYMFQPIRIIVMFFAIIIGIIPLFFPNVDMLSLGFFIPSYIWLGIVAAQMLYPFLIITAEQKFNLKLIVANLIYPFYNLTWVPIMIEGLIDVDKPLWSHTVHKKSIGIDDIEKENVASSNNQTK